MVFGTSVERSPGDGDSLPQELDPLPRHGRLHHT